jgi:hypothetical protein
VASTESERTRLQAQTKESRWRGEAMSRPSPRAKEMRLEPTNLSSVQPRRERELRRDFGQ